MLIIILLAGLSIILAVRSLVGQIKLEEVKFAKKNLKKSKVVFWRESRNHSSD
jgi:hypothetical protein